MSEWAKNAAAFMSLALTQRRLAHQHRRWALEDAIAGKLAESRRELNEANRLWRDAKEHLSIARHHRELGARHGA
jgi:hypothetical protein